LEPETRKRKRESGLENEEDLQARGEVVNLLSEVAAQVHPKPQTRYPKPDTRNPKAHTANL